MIIRKKSIIDFIVAFLCAIITIILFYDANNIKNGTVLISIVGAFFSTLCMLIVIGKLEQTLCYTELSGSVVFFLVAVLYNQNSIIKYSVTSIYDGAIDSRFERFWGTILIELLLIIGTYFWSWIHRKNKVFKKISDSTLNELMLPGILVYFLLVSYIVLAVLSYGKNISNFLRVVQTGYSYLCFSAIAIYVKIENGKYKISTLIPIALLGCALLILTNLSGSKQIIIRAAIIIVCALIYQNKISLKKIKIVLYASPLLMQGIVSISELISGRFVNYTNEWILRYHVFRYDLSDLAMTFALRFSNMKQSWGVVKEAFLYSLPSFLYNDKQEILPMYNLSVKSAGLEGYPMDYNDTIFSFGAQIGGFLGIIIIFFCVIILHEWISKKIVKIKKVGPAIFMSVLGYFSYVESDMFMFVFNTRDLLIYIILALMIYKMFLRVRKSQNRSKAI